MRSLAAHKFSSFGKWTIVAPSSMQTTPIAERRSWNGIAPFAQRSVACLVVESNYLDKERFKSYIVLFGLVRCKFSLLARAVLFHCLPQQADDFENVDSFFRFIHPALLHNLHQLSLSKAIGLVSGIHIRQFTSNQFPLDCGQECNA